MMAISQTDYTELKEYWDYQRKVEYNREKMNDLAEKFDNRIYNDFGPVSIEEFKERLWLKIDPIEYEDPPLNWVPKNEKYRLWNETYPPAVPQLTKPKGKPVILRAKKLDSGNKV